MVISPPPPIYRFSIHVLYLHRACDIVEHRTTTTIRNNDDDNNNNIVLCEDINQFILYE